MDEFQLLATKNIRISNALETKKRANFIWSVEHIFFLFQIENSKIILVNRRYNDNIMLQMWL